MLQTVVEDTPATADLIILDTPFPIELCTCPVEYAGRTCELCARGHARPSRNIADPCVACDCNNLSLDCDVDTAVCISCSGSSEGDNCERCQLGYYGDPTRGIPCLPCQCPTLESSFSPTCFLDSDLNATCDSCSPGYTGRNCEMCMDGFFGNALVSINIQRISVCNTQFVTVLSHRLDGVLHAIAMGMLIQHWGQCATQTPGAVSTASTIRSALSVNSASRDIMETLPLVYPVDVSSYTDIPSNSMLDSHFTHVYCSV